MSHNTKRLETLIAAVLLTLLPGIVPICSAAEEGSADRIKMKRTISDVRKVGVAMMSWLTDQVMGSGDASIPPAAAEGADAGWTIRKPSTAPETALAYRPISHAELTKLLVPDYIDAVPEHDGWGHTLEFALNPDLLATNVLGIRSPGRDGDFETDAYEIGAFGADEHDRDVVWCDGYFVRWPGR